MTNDEAIADRMSRLRSHGTTREPALMLSEPDGPWSYQALELGWNYRMTDIQAALGISQMQRLDDYVTRREQLADRYDRALANSGLVCPVREPDRNSAWHLYTVGWNAEASGVSRRQAYASLRDAGIGVQVHYIPVHLQPLFRARGFRPGQFPKAEAHYERALTLPLYATLSEDEQDRVIEHLHRLLHR